MKVSVIIPSYNSCERLYYNLISLNQQSCLTNKFEVVVVDNGSKDDTLNMISKFQSKYKLKVIRLEENKGRAYARNIGILNSEGEILIFHDADMIAPRNFIRNHLIEHKDSNTVVCGMAWGIYTYYYNNFSETQKYHFNNIKNKYHLTNEFSHAKDPYPLISEKEIMDASFIHFSNIDIETHPFKRFIKEYGENLNGYNFPWRFFITNNCSVYKKNVLETGLFDENFLTGGGEDYDLGYRFYKNGCKFVLKEKIISFHQEHPSHYSDPKNGFYLCDKYNEIDMLLYLFCKNTSIDKNWINEIINDVNKLAKIDKYADLINLYRELLMIIRERAREYIFNNNEDVFKTHEEISTFTHIDLLKIKEQGNELRFTVGRVFFVESLYLLIKDVFGIDMKKDYEDNGKIDNAFCVILSKYRLYQGIALYKSLKDYMKSFSLFVLCVDREAYDILEKMGLEGLTPIYVRQVENDEVLAVKDQRLLSEYCFTLKPVFLLYILDNYPSVNRVTYVDADMYFFSDPEVIFKKEGQYSVLLSAHNYSVNSVKQMHMFGKYNSGFCSFKRDVVGYESLLWWKDQCLKWCFDRVENGKFTDQKYLERLPYIFKGVKKIKTIGVNIAFWNHQLYKIFINDGNYYVNNQRLICYHFALFRIINKNEYVLGHAKYVFHPMMHKLYGVAVQDAVTMVEKINPDFNGFFVEENLKGRNAVEVFKINE